MSINDQSNNASFFGPRHVTDEVKADINTTTNNVEHNNPQYNVDFDAFLGPDLRGKVILFIILLFLGYSLLVFSFTTRIDRQLHYSSDDIDDLLSPLQNQLYQDLLSYNIDIYHISHPAQTLDLTSTRSAVQSYFNNNVGNEFIYYRPTQQAKLQFHVQTHNMGDNIFNQLSSSTPASLTCREYLSTLEVLINSQIIQQQQQQQPSSGSSTHFRYIIMTDAVTRTIPSHCRHPTNGPIVHDSQTTAKYNPAHPPIYYTQFDFAIIFSQNIPPSIPLSQVIFDTTWIQLQPALLVPIPVFQQHILSLQDAHGTITSSHQNHHQISSLNRVASRFATTFGLSLVDYLKLRPNLNTHYHLEHIIFSPQINHANQAQSQNAQAIVDYIAQQLGNSLKLTLTTRKTTDLSLLPHHKSLVPQLESTQTHNINHNNPEQATATMSSFLARLWLLCQSGDHIHVDTTSTSSASTTQALPTLIHMASLNFSNFLYNNNNNDNNVLHATYTKKDNTINATTTTTTLLIPQWGSVLYPQQNTILNDQTTIHHFVSQYKLLLGFGLNPQSTTITHPLTTYSTSYNIPITQLQRDLYQQNYSLVYLHNVIFKLHSTLRLLSNSEHMPFPQHINFQFNLVMDQLLTLSSRYLSPEAKTTTTTTITENTTASPLHLYILFQELAQLNAAMMTIFYHHELLPQLHFPLDQLIAIYAPFFAPTIVPILSSSIRILIGYFKKSKTS